MSYISFKIILAKKQRMLDDKNKVYRKGKKIRIY